MNNKAIELQLSQGAKSVLSSSSGELYDPERGSSTSEPPKLKPSRGSYDVLTEKVVEAFDRCTVTDRNAVYLISAICQALHDIDALSIDINSIIIHRYSSRRSRQNVREMKYKEIKKEFKELNLTAAVVHWDGKLLPNLTNSNKVERLPIIITSGETEIMLGIPLIKDGTGQSRATIVFETLFDWGLDKRVQALCCDTTASNLGCKRGAAAYLEKLLGRELLYLPCRHHIFDIILRSVLEMFFPGTVGPNAQYFKKIQVTWEDLNKSSFKTEIENQKLNVFLEDDSTSIKDYIKKLLQQSVPRDDYKELLELALVFLGDIPPNYHFKKLGAHHHARWMAKAIYASKIYLFRAEYQLKKVEEHKLQQLFIQLFIVTIYIKAWFTSTIAIKCPNHDLERIKKLHNYRTINFSVADSELNKLINQLWYLSSELVVIALFDEDVSVEKKLKIVNKLKSRNDNEINTDRVDDDLEMNVISDDKRFKVGKVDEMLDIELAYFVTNQSKKLFQRFDINAVFLEIHPSQWKESESYVNALSIFTKLKVVNDCAEQGVKLMEDYNGKFTRNEDQQRFILQMVNYHRKKFPTTSKQLNISS